MSYTETVNTDYGQMLVPRFDMAQTPALKHTRRALCHQDIEKLRQWLRETGPSSVFLDVGANIGSFTFGVRDLCAKAHAFEPQPVIFRMMAGSVALNGWTNVFCHNVALGREHGMIAVPQFDYMQPANFGGMEFGPRQLEYIGQQRKPDAGEQVPLKTLDSFGFNRVDVMKIDVEGMELDVLAGAVSVLTNCRPRILIEHAKAGATAITAAMDYYGYRVEPHGTMDLACMP